MITGNFVGEVKRAKDRGGRGYTKWIWLPCCDCGKDRWVQLFRVSPPKVRCERCKDCGAKLKGRNMKERTLRGIHGNNSRGGKYQDSAGYVHVKLYPNDSFYPMANSVSGYVAEHRLVVAKTLGRCLQSWEIVHHRNGIKDDNRYPQNLELMEGKEHHQILTIVQNRIGNLERRITLLEAENSLLRMQLEQYQSCGLEWEI